jgi:peptidoglycan/xylan/chitin deacetylase (PgdA/CDA1 family)
MPDMAIIVVFHSICDNSDASPIVNRTKKFEQFCRFFKKHFTVVSMSDLIGSVQKHRDLTGQMVITFDDGYKDNYLNAVPILRKYDLPATFYIATDYIGTEFQTWWDQKAGVRTKWADWDDIRSMHRMGFEIGAHTMTHANLGQIDEETCKKEVVGSFDRIEKELGVRPKFFSYPYGGREHLSARNHWVLRNIPIEFVASAYGGFVSSHSDPAFLCRLPIAHWYQTPEQFGFELIMHAQRRSEEDTAERVSHSPT